MSNRLIAKDDGVLDWNYRRVVCDGEFSEVGIHRGVLDYVKSVLGDRFEELLVFDDDKRREVCGVFELLEEQEKSRKSLFEAVKAGRTADS